MRSVLILLLALPCCVVNAAVLAQSPAKQASKAPSKPNATVPADMRPAAPPSDETLLPAVKVEFKKDAPISGMPAFAMAQHPFLCAPDGTPVIAFQKNYVPPPDGHFTGADFMPEIYSLDPKGARGFSPQAAPGLHDVWFRSYLVSDSMVGIQVSGTEDDKRGQVTITSARGSSSYPAYTGKHHTYLLEYDLRGTFQKKVQFPDGYNFMRIAPLSDDTFVALAYDTANRVARLLLLDSDLEIVRQLEIPSDMQDSDPGLKQGESGDAMNAAKAQSSLSWWHFAAARNRVLLYQSRREAPVLEVGAGGGMREVTVQAPKGYVLSVIYPANDRWLMQFIRSDLSQMGAIDTRPQTFNSVLYEVDPNDGSLRRRIDLPTIGAKSTPATLACVQDGVVQAFSLGGDAMTRYTADLGR